MNSPTTPSSKHPRLDTARKALLWIGVIALAVLPFPW
jgi:hypothetical protein